MTLGISKFPMERDSISEDYQYYLAIDFIEKGMWKNESNELENSGEHNLIPIVALVLSELPVAMPILRLAHQPCASVLKISTCRNIQIMSVTFPS